MNNLSKCIFIFKLSRWSKFSKEYAFQQAFKWYGDHLSSEVIHKLADDIYNLPQDEIDLQRKCMDDFIDKTTSTDKNGISIDHLGHDENDRIVLSTISALCKDVEL